MSMLPKEKEHVGDGDTFAQVGQPTNVSTTKDAVAVEREADAIARTDGSADEGGRKTVFTTLFSAPLAGAKRCARKEGDKSGCCADVEDCSTPSEDGVQTNEFNVASEKLGAIATRHKAQTLVIETSGTRSKVSKKAKACRSGIREQAWE